VGRLQIGEQAAERGKPALLGGRRRLGRGLAYLVRALNV
jgi:hypothetical protein